MESEKIPEAVKKAIEMAGRLKKTYKSGSKGMTTCPICGGTVTFVIAGKRKHVHATCMKPGCLRFME